MIWYTWRIGRLAWSKNRGGAIHDVDGEWTHLFLGFWWLRFPTFDGRL